MSASSSVRVQYDRVICEVSNGGFNEEVFVSPNLFELK